MNPTVVKYHIFGTAMREMRWDPDSILQDKGGKLCIMMMKAMSAMSI